MRSQAQPAVAVLAVTLIAIGCGGDRDRPAATPPPANAAPRVSTPVAPQHGGRHTAFTVSVTTRHATGVFGRSRHVYFADATAVERAGACVNNRDRAFPAGRAGLRVRARLEPARGEGGELGWCPGLYRGRVAYVEGFACPDRGTCRPPKGFPNRSETVERFTFRVREQR